MSKFKVGDKVRVVNSTSTSNRWIGEEFTVSEVLKYGAYPVRVSSYAGPFDESELELVEEQKTLEQQLQEAKSRVAELEKQLEEAKPKASDMTVGAIILREGDTTSRYIKVGRDQWVWYRSREGQSAPYVDGWITPDSKIDIEEVIREGI